MVSGDDWLVLLGNDFDYAPPEPWARSHSDRSRAQADWDELISDQMKTAWGFPFNSEFKKQWNWGQTSAMGERYGEENESWWPGGDFSSGFWLDDEGGSLNAVYAYLRTLSARWYMPGELGEVVPEQQSIALPELDRTVKPDFGLRSWFWYHYAVFPFEDVM